MPYKNAVEKSEKEKLRILERRNEWFSRFDGCAKCHRKENLEVDHIDPSKKFSHRIWNWNSARRERELVKCQPLCSEHHLEKTVDWSRRNLKHGSKTAYANHGCRCGDCRGWNRATAKKRRDENRKNTFTPRRRLKTSTPINLVRECKAAGAPRLSSVT